MGLTTHVLDTASGLPAAGMKVALYRTAGSTAELLREFTLNADGRSDGPLLPPEAFTAGTYSLHFHVAAYFRACGVALPEPPFLDVVRLDFGVAEPQRHYHVPLLVSPWSHATYRGS
jgi:5-hydroxyisourate hydrolase